MKKNHFNHFLLLPPPSNLFFLRNLNRYKVVRENYGVVMQGPSAAFYAAAELPPVNPLLTAPVQPNQTINLPVQEDTSGLASPAGVSVTSSV